jgi:hypothetical protein
MAAEASTGKVQRISLIEGFTTVVEPGELRFQISPDGSVSRNGVALAPASGAANDARPLSAAPVIGKREPVGDAHEGFYYAGIEDGRDLWLKPAHAMMDHFKAAAWAEEQGGALPTRKQGKHLETIKDEGDFRALFNRSGSFPAGFVWLAEPLATSRHGAWCQRLSDGGQHGNHRPNELPVLCVRR